MASWPSGLSVGPVSTRAKKPSATPKQDDPLRSQGMDGEGGEDFAGRDYAIPGVESDDPNPYKWHTGAKRDHGGEDAIEILVKAMGSANLEVRGSARGHLVRLTGRDLGDDPARWAAWWAERRAMPDRGADGGSK